MKELILLTDGSVHTQSKIGFGAYLAIRDQELIPDLLKNQVKVKQFNDTSSVKLELETLLWALNDIGTIENKVIIYTDSQNILSLSERRNHLEKNKFLTKNGKLISNHELYKEFFKLTERLNLEFVKVQGHKASDQKETIDRLFSLVDKASRKALRKNLHEQSLDV